MILHPNSIMAISRRLKEILFYRYFLKIHSVAKTIKMYNLCLQHYHQNSPLHKFLLIVAFSLCSHFLTSTMSH